MTIHECEFCSNPFPPATPSYRSQTFEGLFELTRHHLNFKGPQPSLISSTQPLLPKVRRYRETTKCSTTSVKVSKDNFKKILHLQKYETMILD